MDLSPFEVQFKHGNMVQLAEVRPRCREDDVIYYDIWMDNRYQYTITPGLIDEEKPCWRIALKNADKVINQELIQTIGVEIESHYL
jgi:hypothetical protein